MKPESSEEITRVSFLYGYHRALTDFLASYPSAPDHLLSVSQLVHTAYRLRLQDSDALLRSSFKKTTPISPTQKR